MKDKRICVGDKVQDKISGLVGISLTRCIYLNGCIQHEVQPLVDEENSLDDAVWIDEKQLGGDMDMGDLDHIIKLGSKVKWWHVGFTGITSAYAIHLSGLQEYEVQPLVDKEGKYRKPRWICESNLEDLEENITDDEDTTSKVANTGRRSRSGGGKRSHP